MKVIVISQYMGKFILVCESTDMEVVCKIFEESLIESFQKELQTNLIEKIYLDKSPLPISDLVKSRIQFLSSNIGVLGNRIRKCNPNAVIMKLALCSSEYYKLFDEMYYITEVEIK